MRIALACLLLLGCAADPDPIEGYDTGQGELVVAHLIDAEFLRFDGKVQPIEELIYTVRVRCRAAGDDLTLRPRVELRVPADGRVPPSVIDTLQRELRAAGVRLITLEQYS